MAQPIISRATQRAFRYYGASKQPVRVDGLTDTYAALDALTGALRDAVVEAIDTGSAIIESEAHSRVPYDEGDLDESIGRNVREDGLQAAVGSGLEYSTFVELGTQHQSAQPWLYPSFLVGARFVRRSMKGWVTEAGQKVRTRTRGRRRKRAE